MVLSGVPRALGDVPLPRSVMDGKDSAEELGLESKEELKAVAAEEQRNRSSQ